MTRYVAPFLREISMVATNRFLAMACLLAACSGGDAAAPPQPPVPVVLAVSVAPASVTLNGIGTEASLTTTLSPSNASGTVTWRTTDPAIATVSGTGSGASVRAVAGGTTRVVAAVGAVEGSATIVVTPIVRALAIAPAAVSVRLGTTTNLTATVQADPGAVSTLGWLSTVPTVATVSSNGVVSALAPGTTTVTAASLSFASVSASAIVTVTKAEVRAVTLSPTTVALLTGATRQLTVTIAADSGADRRLQWQSSAATVAQVDSSGKVIAIAPGTTTITVVSVDNPALSATAQISVSAPTVRAIGLTPVSATLFAGSTKQLTAVIDADAGANTTLIWSSSTPSVATVNVAGLVTALAAGSVTVTARSALVSTVSATASLTVTPPPPLTQWTSSPITTGQVYRGLPLPIWSLANGDAFAVLGDTLVGIRRGGEWKPPIRIAFGSAATVSGSGDVAWLATTNAKIGQWDGTQFVQMASPAGLSEILNIAGISPTEAVASAKPINASRDSGIVLRLRNGSWTRMPNPFVAEMRGVVTTGSAIFAFGQRVSGFGFVSRWADTAWVPMTIPSYFGERIIPWTNGELLVLRSNGSSYLRLTASGDTIPISTPRYTAMPADGGYGGVRMCGASTYAITGSGRVLRWVGTDWVQMSGINEAVPGSFQNFLHCGSDNVLRFSNENGIARWTGSTWVLESFVPQLKNVALRSPNDIYVTTGQGTLMHWDGTSWSTVQSPFDLFQFRSLSLARDGTLFAVSNETPGRVYRYRNGQWTSDLVTSPYAQKRVWAWSSSFALAAADGFVWQKWDGARWSAVTAPNDTYFITGLDGSGPDFAVAVGSKVATRDALGRVATTGAFVAVWNGSDWTSMSAPAAGDMQAVSVVSPTVVFAVGMNGMLRWDGTSWSSFALPPGVVPWEAQPSISAISATEVYATFGTPELWLFDGFSWRALIRLSVPPFTGTFATVKAIPGFGITTGYSGLLMIGSPSGASAATQLQNWFRRR